MVFDPVNRRLFLRNASGAMLAIPLLPSLVEMMTGKALAQTGQAQGCFMFFRTVFGVYHAHKMPAETGFTEIPSPGTPPVRTKLLSDFGDQEDVTLMFQNKLRANGLDSYAILPLGLTG